MDATAATCVRAEGAAPSIGQPTTHETHASHDGDLASASHLLSPQCGSFPSRQVPRVQLRLPPGLFQAESTRRCDSSSSFLCRCRHARARHLLSNRAAQSPAHLPAAAAVCRWTIHLQRVQGHRVRCGLSVSDTHTNALHTRRRRRSSICKRCLLGAGSVGTCSSHVECCCLTLSSCHGCSFDCHPGCFQLQAGGAAPIPSDPSSPTFGCNYASNQHHHPLLYQAQAPYWSGGFKCNVCAKNGRGPVFRSAEQRDRHCAAET